MLLSWLRQAKFFDHSTGSTSAGTIAGTLDTAVLAGSTLLAFVYGADTATSATVADTVNPGNWPASIESQDDSNASSLAIAMAFCLPNTLAGSPTVTATYNVNTTFRGLLLVEVANVRYATSLDKHTSQIQAAPGIGIGAISSGNTATLTGQPNIAIAFSVDTSGTTTPRADDTAGYVSLGSGLAWDLGSNIACAAYKNTSATTALAGTFSDTAGATDRFTTIVVVLINGISITQQPTTQTVTEGTAATFSVTATASPGGGTLSYQWHKNGSNVGTNSSSYTTPTLTIGDDPSTVYCTVTDSNGSTDTAQVYARVIEAPGAAWLKA